MLVSTLTGVFAVGFASVSVARAHRAPVDDAVGFSCLTDMKSGTLVSPEKKGIAIDDMTLRNCSHAIIAQWPNTYGFQEKPSTPVKTARIFKVWTPEWPAEERWKAWNDMMNYIKGNGMTVLVGTSIGCSEAFDKQTWEWTKEFIRLVGRDHIMGLAIGNELEMFHRFRKELNVTDECLDKLWAGGYAFDWFQKVADDMDNMGMGLEVIPLTTVFGGLALAGNSTPFINTPEAAVDTLLSQVVQKYGTRFVFTFNFYPYFDPNMDFDNGTIDQCTGSIANALSWEYDGNVPAVTAVARRKMTNLTGNSTWRMWLGETGWSSPLAPSLISDMKNCTNFSSIATFREFYKGFLAWNLSISNETDPLEPPEHVFYFTIRDSAVFGVPEHFGLIQMCGDVHCKLTVASASAGPTAEEVIALAKRMQLAKNASSEGEAETFLAARVGPSRRR